MIMETIFLKKEEKPKSRGYWVKENYFEYKQSETGGIDPIDVSSIMTGNTRTLIQPILRKHKYLLLWMCLFAYSLAWACGFFWGF